VAGAVVLDERNALEPPPARPKGQHRLRDAVIGHAWRAPIKPTSSGPSCGEKAQTPTCLRRLGDLGVLRGVYR
jgi:hypothetical protein